MPAFSVSVDELRQTARKVHVIVETGDPHPVIVRVSVPLHDELNLAAAEFVGCMSDCLREQRDAVAAVADGLIEVAGMYEAMDAGAQADLHAVGSSEGWTLP